ncbi:MAG TPA: sialidase family protein [Candidatus Thermoplasmatota archaeon]|nr:sialidase family protein [Candidatus Thermoplasmatota archaeon]
MRLAGTLLAASVVLAGCLAPSQTLPPPAPDEGPTEPEALAFLPAVFVDAVRVASEPSVKVARDGTIYVAGPTGTIKYATRPQDAIPNAREGGILQGGIWVSRDGGLTFAYSAGLGPSPYQSAQPGGGDSDIAIDGNGRVYVTDQMGLAAEHVKYSDDGGRTWTASTTPGSADITPVDRQWLRSDPDEPGHVYLNFNNIGNGIAVTQTRDGGATWSGRVVTSRSTAPGPLVTLPGGFVGFSYYEGGLFFTRSDDHGRTWSDVEIPGVGGLTDFFPVAFGDAAGTLYISWAERRGSDSALAYAVSVDRGRTWSEPRTLAQVPGIMLFSWGVGGDAGRAGFVWYEAPDPNGEWYEEAAVALGLDGPEPRVVRARVQPEAVRVGPPCTSGSTCTSGREFGDFQMVSVTPDGFLVVAYVQVLSAFDGGRLVFAKQAAGPRLFDAPPATWIW